jgi:hypothetical protein
MVEMRKYGCLQAIIKSFYSRDLYRDAVVNWNFNVILYLTLLLAICWGCLSVGIQRTVNIEYGTFSHDYFPQIPEITINKGELKTPENRPYLILDPDSKNIVAIIDTSGEYQSLDKTSATILVTKHGVFYQSKSKLGRAHEFSPDLDIEIQPVQISSKLDLFVKWSWVFLFPFFLLFSLCYRIVEAALFAIIGEIFSHMWRVPLTYGEIFKITIFAMTPAIILGTVLNWFSISFAHMWLMYFVLSMGYLLFGILANKKS